MGAIIAEADRPGSQTDEKIDVEQLDRTGVPPATLQSFAHLDEKKILRKVSLQPVYHAFSIFHVMLTCLPQMDMRLIPMLALLYLLSFLDRTILSSDRTALALTMAKQAGTLAMQKLKAYKRISASQTTSITGA